MLTLKIISVAACKDGLIFSLPPPARHHNISQMMFRLGIQQNDTVTQGFLTNTGEFVERLDAYIIAKAAGQMNRRQGPGTYQGNELFSEDLW